MKVAVIPALDEEGNIGTVVRGVGPYVDAVVVADNGSRDRTAEVAREAGAEVVFEAQRGYGAACLAAVARARALGADVLLYLDGDGSDDASGRPTSSSAFARRARSSPVPRRRSSASGTGSRPC